MTANVMITKEEGSIQSHHNRTVTVEHNDKRYEVLITHLAYTTSSWSESRGQHFGSECEEEMGEVEWNFDEMEYDVFDVTDSEVDRVSIDADSVPSEVSILIREMIEKKADNWL